MLFHKYRRYAITFWHHKLMYREPVPWPPFDLLAFSRLTMLVNASEIFVTYERPSSSRPTQFNVTPPPPPPHTHTLINRQNINVFKQQANTMTAMSRSHLIYNWVCHFLFSLFLSASFDEYIVMDRGLIEWVGWRGSDPWPALICK